jgi:hypothetical protein
MAHSVPDAVGLAIETSAGRVFHTGDWKLDHTPVDGLKTDVGRLAELGNRGVDLLLADSTNAERPGFTRSERVGGEAFRQIIPARRAACPVLQLRLEHSLHAAGDRRCRRHAPQGRRRRPLDAPQHERRAQPIGVEMPESMLVKPADLTTSRHEQLILHRLTGERSRPSCIAWRSPAIRSSAATP